MALIVIAKNRKPYWLSTCECIKKLSYIHIMEFYQTIKELPIFATIWISFNFNKILENVNKSTVIEIRPMFSQRQRNWGGGMDNKEAEGNLWIVNIFIILRMVMIRYIYVKIKKMYMLNINGWEVGIRAGKGKGVLRLTCIVL